MRTITFACVVGFCHLLGAQSPLTTSYAGEQSGLAGGCIYFDLEVASTVTFHQLDVNLADAPGSSGAIEVHLTPDTWIGHTDDPAAWGLATSGTVLAAGIDQPSSCSLASPFTLGPGSYGVALRHVGVTARYAVGNTTNEVVTNSELTLRAGGVTPGAFSGAPLTPRVFNGGLHYTAGGAPLVLAKAESYGQGCYARPGAFAQLFTANEFFDLDNTTLRFVPNADGGYDVTRTNGAAIQPPAHGALGLGDDTMVVQWLPFAFPYPGGETASIRICSNGYLWLQPSSVADYTPTMQEFADEPPRIAMAWMDFNPGAPGSGNAFYERDPADRFVTITFDDVWEHGTFGGSLSTFQTVLYPSGEFVIRLGSVSRHGKPCIVGFSPGDGNLGTTPPSTDLSSALPMQTAFSHPLTLTAGPRPAPGATVIFRTVHVPANALHVFNLMSIVPIEPGIDLGSLGAPGCQHLVMSEQAVTLSGDFSRTLGPLPFSSAYVGLPVVSQSACMVLGLNSLGLITSNAVRVTLGDL